MDHRRAEMARVRAAVTRHRRLLAAGLAAAAVAFAIEAASPASPPGAPVTVAARDLPGGATVSEDDVQSIALPPDAVPSGTLPLPDAVGGTLAGPVRAGEPLTDHRFVGPSLLDGWGDELVAAPVRVADAGAATLIRPGDRINLLAAGADGVSPPSIVASGVPVLTVGGADVGALGDGALVVVATTEDEAAQLAQAAVTSRITFTIGASDAASPEP